MGISPVVRLGVGKGGLPPLLAEPRLDLSSLGPSIQGVGQATLPSPSLRSNLVTWDQRCIGLLLTIRVFMDYLSQTEIQISDEVKRALNEGLRVVALESTVIA